MWRFLVLLLLAPLSPIRFEEFELPFRLEHSPTPEKYLPASTAGGVAALDFDSDGRLDLFFTNGAELPSLRKTGPQFSNRLLHNEGGGRFADVTRTAGLEGQGYSIGAAAADYDNDGRPDLFVAGVNGNHLYRNLGGGRFADVTAQAGLLSTVWSVAAGWLDFDNDGLLDLFVVNYVRWSPDAEPVCQDPGRKVRVYCHPRHFAPLPNSLYRNRGDGTFEDVSQKSGIAAHPGKGMSLAVADYDNDGLPDIYVTNDTQPNFLFHNKGRGQFEEVAFAAGAALTDDGRPVSAMGVDFRDLDNDGLPDIVFTALTGEHFPVFRNLGKGQFRDATYSSRLGALSAKLAGWGIALADFNNDGTKDIFTANSHVTDNIEQFSGDVYRLRSTLFVNAGNGTFTAGPELGQPRAYRGSVVADFNNDGQLDIAATALGDPATLWLNRTAASGNHWIDLRLQGTKSNRDGIGAVLRIGNQVNHQTSAVGYASSVLAPVHFGLGQISVIPQIEIRWPSGRAQMLRNVRADRILSVTEP